MAEVAVTFPPTWVNDRDFNPTDALIKFRGRDYLPVQARLKWFLRDQREMIAKGLARQPYQVEIVGHMIDRESGWSRHHVRVIDVLGNRVESTGSESANDFGDYDEKSYTKALGRALALLGYATGDAIDFDEEHRVVDAPVERPQLAANAAPHTAAPVRQAPPTPRAEPAAPSRPVPSNVEVLANERQVASIQKLCAALGRTEPDFSTLTFSAARELLTELSRAYSESRRAS